MKPLHSPPIARELCETELYYEEKPHIESDAGKYEKLSDKAQSALKAETEKMF